MLGTVSAHLIGRSVRDTIQGSRRAAPPRRSRCAIRVRRTRRPGGGTAITSPARALRLSYAPARLAPTPVEMGLHTSRGRMSPGRGEHWRLRSQGRLHPNRVGTYVRARRVAPRCRTRRPIGPERNRVDRGDVEPCHGLRPGVARVRPCYALDLTSRLKRMGRLSTSVMAGSPADPALVTLYPRTLDVPDTQLLHPVRDHRGSLSGTWDRITWAR